MRSQTFLGQAYVARSKNFADQLSINLFLNRAETSGTKDQGVLYGTPGLDLKATLPTGPVRGDYAFKEALYALGGSTLYSLDKSFNMTTVGTITPPPNPLTSEPVSWINNGTQVAFFDGINGYLFPGGQPLTGGTIGAGGAGYAVDDTITLVDVAGNPSSATAQLTVTTVSGGVVTGFSVTTAGAFATLPASFQQANSSGGGSGFTLTAPTFGAFAGIYKLNLPFSNPSSANYQDGFGVVVETGTTNVWQSNLFDLSLWDPLNFSDVEARPSDLQAIGFLHRQLVMLQKTTGEVWINTGASGFVFAEEQGVHLETGIVAPHTLCNAGESIVWLAQTSQGRAMVMEMQGYEPIEISTDAIEYAMAQYERVDDAIAFVYRMEKRVFYVLIFPSADATWVCDLAGKDRSWHQWLYFYNGKYSRHRSNCATFFNGQTVVGDYQNGNIYALNLDTYTDAGQPIRRSRSWRALGAPTEVPVRFKYLWIDMQSGVGVAEADNPQMMLDFSDDGGHTWSAERFGSAGKAGEYGTRVKWNRLGSTARGQGEDRIWRLSTDDQFAVAMTGAYQG